MGAFDQPHRLLSPVGFLPVNPLRVRVNTGNSLTRSLAFLFLPYRNVFVDVVRRDTAKIVGTVSPIATPFGRSWVMGTPTLSAVGGFETAGGDAYYQSGVVNNSFSIACGAWNHAIVTNPSNRNVFAYWANSSAEADGLEVGLQIIGGSMRPYCQVSGGGTSASATGGGFTVSPPLPPIASPTLNNEVPLGMSICGMNNGSSVFMSASFPGVPAPWVANALSGKTVTSLAQVFIGNQFSGAATGRPLLWVAGWFRALSLAEMNAVVANNGGLPLNFLLSR
jgi:hypothetical protein